MKHRLAESPAQNMKSLHAAFDSFAERVSRFAGSVYGFIFAACMVTWWAFAGEHVIEWTDMVQFLLLFLIAAAQGRYNRALHVKLDELLTHIEGPRNEVAGIEDRSEDEIKAIRAGGTD